MRTIKKSIQALREEDHRRALYAALVFIMLLILFFLLVSLEVPDPPLEEEIVEISAGLIAAIVCGCSRASGCRHRWINCRKRSTEYCPFS